MSKIKPRVFISYAHENEYHIQMVQALGDWLTGKGIWVIADFPYSKAKKAPTKGWIAWMQHEIEEADLVLVVGSPLYKMSFEKRAETGTSRGVAFEGALISQEIYDQNMENERFIPILTDQGQPDHLPGIFRDFYMGLRFPSGFNDILTAVQSEIDLTGPKLSPERLRPALLCGPGDNRLAPREGRVYGRELEIDKVLKFLKEAGKGQAPAAILTGPGGIGKSEVCKAALAAYLQEPDCIRTFFFTIPDLATVEVFIEKLSVGLNLADIEKWEELLPRLPSGIYYLDNIEGLLGKPEGIECLVQLRKKPGIRIIASSRIEFEGLGQIIEIRPLPLFEAVQLFVDKWKGREQLKDTEELRDFVGKELGCQPLALTILARLGHIYSLERLQEKWAKLGLELAEIKHGEGIGRLDSLHQSMLLSSQVLEVFPGALLLWSLAALFPAGLEENTLEFFMNEARIPETALHELVAHHVLSRAGDCYQMLPTMARFALMEALDERYGFNWYELRKTAYRYFIQMAELATSEPVTAETLNKRNLLLRQFDALSDFILRELGYREPDKRNLWELNLNLYDIYGFRASQSRALLSKIIPFIDLNISKATTYEILGEIESRLGLTEDAFANLNKAIRISREEKYNPGVASSLLSLGILEFRLGNLAQARKLYEESIQISLNSNSVSDQIFALNCLGTLELRMGNLDSARMHFDEALALSNNENLEVYKAGSLICSGELEIRAGNFVEARNNLETAIEIYESRQDYSNIAFAQLTQSYYEIVLGNLEVAQNLLVSALKIFIESEEGLAIAETLRLLGLANIFLGRDSAAYHYTKDSIELFRKHHSDFGAAWGIWQLAGLGPLKQDFEKARLYLNESFNLFQQEEFELGLGIVRKSQLDLEAEKGNFDLALRYYEEAEQFFINQKFEIGFGDLFRSRSTLAMHIGDFSTALDFGNESLKIYKRMGLSFLMAITNSLLGDIALKAEHIEEARDYYSNAIELFGEGYKGIYYAETLVSLGELEMTFENFDNAADLFQRAIAAYSPDDNNQGYAIAIFSLGKAEAGRGNWDKAQSLLEEASRIFEDLNHTQGLVAALASLGSLNFEQGNYLLVIEYCNKLLELLPKDGSAEEIIHVYTDMIFSYHFLERQEEKEGMVKDAIDIAELIDKEEVYSHLINALFVTEGSEEAVRGLLAKFGH